MPNCQKAITDKLCEGGRCCGLVPIPQRIYETHIKKQVRPTLYVHMKELVKGRIYAIPVTEDRKCVFLTYEGRCNIYKNRPPWCHRFGTIETNPCPYLTPKSRVRPLEDRIAIERNLDAGNWKERNALMEAPMKLPEEEMPKSVIPEGMHLVTKKPFR